MTAGSVRQHGRYPPWLLAVLLLSTAPASAEYYDGPAYAFPVTDMISPAIAGTAMDSYIERNRRTPRTGNGRGEVPPVPAVANLTVGTDPAISQRVKNQFRDQLVRANPGKQADIDRALARDWLAGYRDEIARPNGLDAANLADAVTAYLVAAWAIVHKQTQISPRAIASVRDHVRSAMAASPQTARLDARARQDMAEQLIYQTVLIMANRTQIARTRDTVLADAASRQYRAAVKAGAKVDLQGLRLLERGFTQD